MDVKPQSKLPVISVTRRSALTSAIFVYLK
jgi:hypothetical protein